MAFRSIKTLTLLVCLAGQGEKLQATTWSTLIEGLEGDIDDACKKINQRVADQAKNHGIVDPKPAHCFENLLRIEGILMVEKLRKEFEEGHFKAKLDELERDLKRLPKSNPTEQAAGVDQEPVADISGGNELAATPSPICAPEDGHAINDGEWCEL